MTKTTSAFTSVAAMLEQFQTATGATDEQLAKAIGYESGKVITMIKDGRMRLPVNKVVDLAKAIDGNGWQIMRTVLHEGAPDILSALDAVMPGATLATSEVKLIETLRELKGNRDVAPLVFDGRSVIALLAL